MHRRLGMYTMHESFGEAAALIVGYDTALDSSLISGFREWLVDRSPGRPELAFPSLVLQEAFPEPRTEVGELSDAENAIAVNKLFDLLEAYFDTRG